MEKKFWLFGFIIWAFLDYFIVKIIVPSFIMAPDKHLWLSAFFWSMELAPIFVIGQLIFVCAQIYVFTYIASWIYEQIRRKRL